MNVAEAAAGVLPPPPLRALIVDDSESDRGLIVRELQRQFTLEAETAETETEFLTALERDPDVVLLDYQLPRFSAVRALTLLRARDSLTPVIVVSGAISEEAAVECMRLGANDYVLKDRIARLRTAVARAIEERRLKESGAAALDALREAEERYRTLVETIPAVVYRAEGGHEGRWRYVSPQIQDLLGYTPDEWLAGPCIWHERVHPEDRELVLREEQHSHAAGGRLRSTYRLLARDGRTVWVRDAATASRSADGRLVYEGVIYDISESVEAERVSRRLAAIIRSTSDAVVSFDLDARITSWNEGAERMLGYSRDEALAMTAEDLVAAERWPLQRSLFARVCLEQPVPPYDAEWLDRAGTPVPVSISAAPIMDAAGEVTGVSWIARDISEQRAIEAERHRLERELDRSRRLETVGMLAGGIAHDFNNLLAVILNFASFVADELEGELRDDVLEIKRAGERAAVLTTQLLSFSRQEMAEPEPVAIDELLAGAESLISHAIGAHIELELAPNAPDWTVMGNPGQIEQVLVNLAVNARDAMGSGGRLRIATAEVVLSKDDPRLEGALHPGEWVLLELTDTGTGITEDVLERMFDPFYTTKPTGEGTGLGLATVYGIVSKARGTITVDSKLGAGTTFRVWLPRAHDAGAARTPAQAADPDTDRIVSASILLVEDEPAVAKVAQRVLERAGLSVTWAANGDEALRLCRDPERSFDLLLTDVVMPGMLGSELAERLQELHPGTPALFMSGYTDNLEALRLIREGGQPLLHKPFDPGSLLSAVRAALQSGAGAAA